MKASEYIRQTFLDFGVRISDAALLRITTGAGLDSDAEVDAPAVSYLDAAIVLSVPNLLLVPESVSEGGFGVSRASAESIKSWYSMKCAELGMEDALSGFSKVKFL